MTPIYDADDPGPWGGDAPPARDTHLAAARKAIDDAMKFLSEVTVSDDGRARAARILGESIESLAWLSVLVPTEWKAALFIIAGAPRFARQGKELEQAVKEARALVSVPRIATPDDAPPPEPEDALPKIIVTDGQAASVIDAAWASVLDGPPRLFMKGGVLTILTRFDGTAVLRACNSSHVMSVLIRSARWFKFVNKRMAPCSPPPDYIAEDMIAAPHEVLPPIETVAYTPCFAPDGSLRATHGYHPDVRMWIESPPSLPASVMSNKEAVELLTEWLVDFPFASDADRCHAFGLFLLPFVRTMIDGPVPPHLVEAPAAGTGKTLLARVLCLAATGRDVSLSVLDEKEDERRKVITSALMSGRQVILFDNIKDKVDSPALEAVTTSTSWTDRLMGGNQEVTLPVRATFIFTGNNAEFSPDMTRRLVLVRIASQEENPSDRTSFEHPDILGWTTANRDRLVHAAICLIESWIQANRPGAPATMGSFESWCSIIGGILTHAGVPKFLANREDLRAAADPGREEWVELIGRWKVAHGDRLATTSDILALTDGIKNGDHVVRPALLQRLFMKCPDTNGRVVILGRHISSRVDQVFSGVKITKKKSNVSGWCLVPVGKTAPAPVPSPVPDEDDGPLY